MRCAEKEKTLRYELVPFAQVAWLGWPTSTGHAAFQYIALDAVVAGEASEWDERYSEKVLMLDSLFVSCHRAKFG